jgi:hypothetical protein
LGYIGLFGLPEVEITNSDLNLKFALRWIIKPGPSQGPSQSLMGKVFPGWVCSPSWLGLTYEPWISKHSTSRLTFDIMQGWNWKQCAMDMRACPTLG